MLSKNQIPQKLSHMLKEINNNQGFRKFMKKIVQKMNFDKKNILNLTLQKVQALYVNVKNKLNHASFIDQTTRNLETSLWLQNQLRIFIYILCAYLFVNKISISELKSHDFTFLNDLFPNKKQEHLEYQVKLLINKKNPKWVKEQSQLFREIMTQNQESNRWNFIAKQLFIRSFKKFFKTPKQCRERWINHEDPKKLKGNWETFEDVKLLSSIILFGKKWTLIAHKLDNTRTQNGVKNRYNSLIKTAKRQYGHDRSQQSLIEKILKQKYGQIKNGQQSNGEKNIQQSQQQKQKIDTTFQKHQSKKLENNFYLQFSDKMDIQHARIIENNEEIYINPNISQNNNLQSKYGGFQFMLKDSDQLQNVEWNGQQSHSIFNQAFYFMEGTFYHDDSHHL